MTEGRWPWQRQASRATTLTGSGRAPGWRLAGKSLEITG